MNVTNMVNGIRVSYNKTEDTNASSKKKWSLTDSLTDKIIELAKADALQTEYMGTEYHNLLQNEVSKVAPNRAAAMARATAMMNSQSSENAANEKIMKEADEKHLRMLLGLPYKAKVEGGPMGTGAHIYDENGDEILSYTPNVGWHQFSSKEEKQVDSAMTAAYYEAYHEARQSMKTNAGTTQECTGTTSTFDAKA